EAAGSRGAVEADVFEMPQHRVHRRRPRLRGAADLVADAYGSKAAPAGQPLFGHPPVLPRPDIHGDRIVNAAHTVTCDESYSLLRYAPPIASRSEPSPTRAATRLEHRAAPAAIAWFVRQPRRRHLWPAD